MTPNPAHPQPLDEHHARDRQLAALDAAADLVRRGLLTVVPATH